MKNLTHKEAIEKILKMLGDVMDNQQEIASYLIDKNKKNIKIQIYK